jgi:hypothetical protein
VKIYTFSYLLHRTTLKLLIFWPTQQIHILTRYLITLFWFLSLIILFLNIPKSQRFWNLKKTSKKLFSSYILELNTRGSFNKLQSLINTKFKFLNMFFRVFILNFWIRLKIIIFTEKTYIKM